MNDRIINVVEFVLHYAAIGIPNILPVDSDICNNNNTMIIIALSILGLKTSNNLQQFKYKNDIKQYFTETLKN